MDVLLRRGEERIACEISVTTSAEHELGNVRKSLDAGVDQVVVVSPTTAGVRRIENRAKEGLAPADLERVHFLTPQDLLAHLDEQGGEADGESGQVLGYKVKTRVKSPSGDQAAKSQGVARTIAQALRRLKGKR